MTGSQENSAKPSTEGDRADDIRTRPDLGPNIDAHSRRDPIEELASRYIDELRAGETPSVEDFTSRYPHLAEQIRELFPFIAALEDLKAERELLTVEQLPEKETDLQKLGNCQIIREIGRGGMGVVYEAEEAPLGRRVAVKLLPWRFAKTSRWRAHFVREARIAAQLKHPNIVPVFSFGTDGPHSFFVMQLVEGIGLDKIIKRLREPPGMVTIEQFYRQTQQGELKTTSASKAAQKSIRRYAWNQLGRIALQAASALQYAHQQGTLHRDIKPGNLLIDVNGNVWIADFGLALNCDSTLLASQAPMAGTLRYMAPEQFKGEFDLRSDIYSLGATLYELCTLRPAFAGQDRTKVAKAVRKHKLTSPSRYVPQIPSLLERIILKAMNRDPSQRYQSAEELRIDLLRFLNPQKPDLAKRLWDWAKNRFGGPKRLDSPPEDAT